jgi:hypothetical protein
MSQITSSTSCSLPNITEEQQYANEVDKEKPAHSHEESLGTQATKADTATKEHNISIKRKLALEKEKHFALS